MRGVRARSIAAALVLLLPLAAAGCGKEQSTPTTGKPVEGGVATFAEKSNATPNYIFPFMSNAYFSVTNISYLQYLLYRPLYWFGQQGKPVANDQMSLANKPSFSDGNRTVKITLRDYRWSNGEQVTADNVRFWLNMWIAEKKNWAVYVPGGIPDDISSVEVDNPHQLTLHLNKTYSQKWFLYNELSQITPMPKAWDRTAHGAADCSHAVADCAAVYDYLSNQAKSLNSYAQSPLWSVVDGPWKLKSFNADGNISFVPNKSYSGPNKPHLDQFNEAPFADDSAEYNVLRSGDGSIQVGKLPQSNAPAIPDGQDVGHNPLEANYTLARWYSFGVNYFSLNWNNPQVGPIFRQTYFRQALQSLVDQKSIIKAVLHGYGVPTYGPVPTTPENPYASAQTEKDPWTYDPERAKKMLADHGWSTPEDGVGTCQRPGTGPHECGAGIKAGQPLEFSLQYASGATEVTLEMQQLQSSATRTGVQINLSSAPFNTVIGTAIACQTGKPDCNWQMGNWGAGWAFAPDFYPSGEQILQTGAGSNEGNVADPKLDALIDKTKVSDSVQAMREYGAYGADIVPAIREPNADYAIMEIQNNLKGVTPLDPFLNITPENWYYVK